MGGLKWTFPTSLKYLTKTYIIVMIFFFYIFVLVAYNTVECANQSSSHFTHICYLESVNSMNNIHSLLLRLKLPNIIINYDYTCRMYDSYLRVSLLATRGDCELSLVSMTDEFLLAGSEAPPSSSPSSVDWLDVCRLAMNSMLCFKLSSLSYMYT